MDKSDPAAETPSPEPVVGIDLGTTTCAVAQLTEENELECYPLEGDRYLLPSALYIDGELLAGETALARGLDNADAVVEAFKRDMGDPHYHRKVAGHWVPPEVLSALLLDDLRRRIGPHADATRAVITVPAYFDERRRKATLDAGKLAGLDVIDIVNEPVAAALAELHHAGLLGADTATPSGQPEPQRLLVYDLGGGTFDVSVLSVEGSEITTLASDGDVRLGGRDFDERLVDHVSERFLEQHGIDPRADFGLTQRLWRLAEEAKRRLSDADSTTVSCAFAGMKMDIEVTRQTFTRLIEPMLERTLATATDALEQAGLTWDQLDRVLLVGGSSRIPAVAEKVQRETGIVPSLSHAPDLAVARGAALFAAMGSIDQLASLKVVNVNAHSLGVAGVEPRTGQPVNRIIIPRNSRLPASRRQKFVTKKAGQKTVKIKIVEGENENPEYCVPVGTCVATLGGDLPAQTEVLVTCRVGTNGTLSVSCVVPYTKQGAHVEIRRDGLLDLESLDVWRSRLLGGPVAPAAEASRHSGDLPTAPPVSSHDDVDRVAVCKRIDYLCQEAGKACAELPAPAGAFEAQQQLLAAHREHQALGYLLRQVRRELAREVDKLGKAKLQASAASVRTYLNEAERLLTYSRVAFGARCLESETVPDGLKRIAAELRELRESLANWSSRSGG